MRLLILQLKEYFWSKGFSECSETVSENHECMNNIEGFIYLKLRATSFPRLKKIYSRDVLNFFMRKNASNYKESKSLCVMEIHLEFPKQFRHRFWTKYVCNRLDGTLPRPLLILDTHYSIEIDSGYNPRI